MKLVFLFQLLHELILIAAHVVEQTVDKIWLRLKIYFMQITARYMIQHKCFDVFIYV